MLRPISTSLLATVVGLAGAAQAQTTNPLTLDVFGGSMPGTLSFEMRGGNYFFEPCLVAFNSDPGPTPLSLFDPWDLRSIQVGQAGMGYVFGFMGPPHPVTGVIEFQSSTVSVPLLSNLVDQSFFFQGVTIGGATTIVDRVSNPMAITMAQAGTWRDRGVSLFYDRIFATSILRQDNRTMVVGGASGALLAQFARDTTEIYDPVTDLFYFGPLLTMPRSMHTQTELDDGRTLLVGGVNATNLPQAGCEIYDPVADQFVLAAQMHVPRMGHTAVKLSDGKVLVSGGFQALNVMPTQLNALFDIVDSIEIYDPATDTWTLGPDMSEPKAGHLMMRRPNGQVLLAGGISWLSLPTTLAPYASRFCDIYDPVTNTISAGPSMAVPHALCDPADIGNDRWLVAGGMTSMTLLTPGVSTGVAEIYDAVANTWSPAGSMSTVRCTHKTIPIGNGKWMAVGGGNGTIDTITPLASCEIYDSATNSWSAGPSLGAPRGAAAIAEMPSGQAFLMGGSSTLGNVLISTEWFYR